MEIKFNERLRVLRKEQGETQVQVAAAVGLVEQHYQKLERGVNLPNLENTWKLADHFGVTIDYLVGRTDER
ncbi:helix-turn-helix domain-containing protein [Oscillibacter sp.]|jgi:transcriptional regulator with XRE-family HTH domain|uniref:helix-turn-helix domain-containing protein n=1 Tax=Oscillibacter sp. TaxID=1945593 RepID=UPI0021724DF9|nr:helix-turn-helix transcriptional regulator [Oscillibacter sp.]MCI9648699.1 helix-turn-helix transcriptional regulator [Oscillibacter sp.]